MVILMVARAARRSGMRLGHLDDFIISVRNIEELRKSVAVRSVPSCQDTCLRSIGRAKETTRQTPAPVVVAEYLIASLSPAASSAWPQLRESGSQHGIDRARSVHSRRKIESARAGRSC